jgi:hypothetical protein
MPEAALARSAGAYALRAYLPASLAARTFRNTLRRLRGKAGAPATRLPQVAWPQLLKSRPIELTACLRLREKGFRNRHAADPA